MVGERMISFSRSPVPGPLTGRPALRNDLIESEFDIAREIRELREAIPAGSRPAGEG